MLPGGFVIIFSDGHLVQISVTACHPRLKESHRVILPFTHLQRTPLSVCLYLVLHFFFNSIVPRPVTPATRWSFVCWFLLIELFLARQRGPPPATTTSLRGSASFATYNSRTTLTVLANLWECRPKLLT